MNDGDASRPEPYYWLSQKAKTKVEAGRDERIAFIRGEHFVNHPQMSMALEAMSYVHTQTRRRRMECVFIGGPSGVGKTLAIKRFLEVNGLEVADDGLTVLIRNGKASVVTADLSGINDCEGFFERIVDGCISSERPSIKYNPSVIARMVAARGSSTLVIDEADRIAELARNARDDVLSQLKWLTNSVQLGIILLGTHKLDDLISGEDTLRHRFIPDVRLTPLKNSDDFRAFAVNLARRMPLRKPPEIDNSRCLRMLVDQTNGRQPDVVGLIKRAAIRAVVDSIECLNATVMRGAIENPYLHHAGTADDE